LRKSFLEEGFLNAARQITAAIHRHNQNSLEFLFFDLTCEWGANYLRPLELAGGLSLICSVIYWIGMRFAKRSDLYVVATGQRITTAKGKERVFRIGARAPQPDTNPDQLELEFPQKQKRSTRTWAALWPATKRLLRREFRSLGTTILFSLMSVFNLGFREFNFGRWIRMVQPRDFDIRASGWMRTVSGIQSLLGVVLVALSLLSYLGHPFD
jgi:hypothetical protein